jgi:hypothetical protein
MSITALNAFQGTKKVTGFLGSFNITAGKGPVIKKRTGLRQTGMFFLPDMIRNGFPTLNSPAAPASVSKPGYFGIPSGKQSYSVHIH